MKRAGAVVLLYGFNDREKLRRIKAAALSLRLQVKTAEEEDYGVPVGVLAFCTKDEVRIRRELQKEAAKPEEPGSDPETISELMVMAGFDNSEFNGFLSALRKYGVGPIPYKAVLTETNQNWNGFELYREICEEHERMRQLNHPEGR